MDERQIVRFLAAGRIAVGTALVLAPRFAGSRWIGEGARAPGVAILARALGIRDLALGAGALQALSAGEPVRPWVLAGAASDGVDLVATALAAPSIGARRAVAPMLVAGSAAATALVTADRVDG